MTAVVVLAAPVSSLVFWSVLIAGAWLAAIILLDRRTIGGLVLAAAFAAGLLAHDISTPKPNTPIYCPCSLTLCLLGLCVPAHAHDTTAMTPWGARR